MHCLAIFRGKNSSAMSSCSFQNLFRTLIFGNSITVRKLLQFSKNIFSEFFFFVLAEFICARDEKMYMI